MDDDALIYFDSLNDELRGNYNDLSENVIEHYDTGSPLSTQWSELNQRKQHDNETVTQYHDEILKLARRIHLEPEQMLYIFIDGLDENTFVTV